MSTEDDGFITIHPAIPYRPPSQAMIQAQIKYHRALAECARLANLTARASFIPHDHPPTMREIMTQTKGEYRVGIDFNPSASDLVGQIKRKAADLIDLIQEIREDHDGHAINPEIGRLKALAHTAIEDGAMWAVKAATKPEPK